MSTNLPIDVVPLPSQGLLYPKTHPFYGKKVVEYKAITPREEDILLNPAYIKQGIAIEKLVSSCLMDDCDGVDVDELLVGDVNALMIAIRISGYGASYDMKISCPHCDNDVDFSLSLSSLPVQYCNLKSENNTFPYQLSTGDELKFRFMTYREHKKLVQSNDFSPISKWLSLSVVEVNGNEDRAYVNKFIRNMAARDSRSLRSYIQENEPKVDLSADFECSICSYSETFSLPSDEKFFSLKPEDKKDIILEPFFLLGYYFGMSWETYMDYPVAYKRWLIKRIEEEIEKANKAGNSIPSKGAHHQQNPQVRQMTNMHRTHPPAKLKRFS